MKRAVPQIAKQVESHAAAIGSPDYPSRRTVYRILSAEISQAEQKQKKRSIGWQGYPDADRKIRDCDRR